MKTEIVLAMPPTIPRQHFRTGTSRFWAIMLAAILLVTSVFGNSAPAQEQVEVYGTTMGVIQFSVRVVVDEADKAKMQLLKTEVFNSLDRVNQLMSTYQPDSDISRLNASESTDWIEIDAETHAVVERAIEIAQLTEGAFDPTVGPAVNAWNFGPNKSGKPDLPSESEIAKFKEVVGFEKIALRSDPPSIRKANPAVQLDLSAIAKGYAVDRVGRTLESLGHENFMIEVGGEILVAGTRPSGTAWKVGVEKPINERGDPEKRLHRVLNLVDSAVATSGDYRNFVDIGDQRFSHTIDPQTCRPVQHATTIASVVAPDCMTADAMATAVMVLGGDKGRDLCEQLGYPVMVVLRSDTESGLPLKTFASSDYPLEGNQNTNQENTNKVADSPDQSAKKSSESNGSSILPVFAATFVIFALMILGMAVGAIFNNKPVTGSCGGIANMQYADGESVCGICSKPTTDCTERIS